jgi:hypothetical protein
MTREQWIELAKHIKTAYPNNSSFMQTEENAAIWYNLVMNWSYEDCKAAVWKHIKESNYPPSLHELKACYEIRREEITDYNRRIKDSYREMENYYPECLRDSDSKKTFVNALKQVKQEKRIKYALKIKEAVIGRVMDAERGNTDNLPSLSESIRSCFDEFRRKS